MAVRPRARRRRDRDACARTSTAERELRQEAEAEARRLGAVVESSDDAIFSLTPEGRIETWNPGAERLFGYTGRRGAGAARHADRPGARGRRGPRTARSSECGPGERVAGREAVALGRGDRRIDVALTASPILDATGAIAGVSCVARDIAERKRFEAKLRHLADHDSVTGLVNRRRFEESLASHLSRPGRADGAVLILDLDDFKLINDRLGHRAGDEALEAVARLAQRSLGPRSILARLGGDEFAALLPGADAVGAEAAAHALLEAVRELSLVVDGRQVHLTVSVGVALVDDERATVQELLSGADAAMYAAKEAGRDRMAMVAPGSASSTEERLGAIGLIRRALDEDRFVLHAQPIRDLRTGEVGRHEVLLRLLDDDNRLLLPEAFLRSAERFGHIGAIDRWVVRRAIRLIAAAQVSGTELCLEVNLSGRSIGDPELPRVVEAELEATGIDASRLVLEITETAAIANMDQARELADPAARPGLPLRPRRLRLGLLLLLVPQAPAARLREDRRRVRAQPRLGARRRAGGQGDGPDRERAGPADDRRVRGGRGDPPAAGRAGRGLRAGRPRRPPAPALDLLRHALSA